jgi:hypothetical protein
VPDARLPRRHDEAPEPPADLPIADVVALAWLLPQYESKSVLVIT